MNKYDEAIEYLTENPGQIYDAWMDPDSHQGGCLFKFLPGPDNVDQWIGCLTQIRFKPKLYSSRVPFLDEIIQDERIPFRPSDITIEDLPVFKEYRERVDAWVAEQK